LIIAMPEVSAVEAKDSEFSGEASQHRIRDEPWRIGH
jgi:hypothetical protein